MTDTSAAILSEQLKKYRKDCGYTQAYVADYIQLSRAAYANYEQGFRLPDVYTLDRIASLYNTSIESFLYPEDFYNSFKNHHRLPYEEGRIPEVKLSKDEQQLLYIYRQLTNTDKNELLHLARYKQEKR